MSTLLCSEQHVLIGNSFPLSLIRRPVTIDVVSRDEFLKHAKGQIIHSFWGHENTLMAASSFIGLDLTPRVYRAAITLDQDGYPQLDGISFRTCWLVSPILPSGFRPLLEKEVRVEEVQGWFILRMNW